MADHFHAMVRALETGQSSIALTIAVGVSAPMTVGPSCERMVVPNSLDAVAVVGPADFFEQMVIDGLNTDLRATIRHMCSRLNRPHRTASEILDRNPTAPLGLIQLRHGSTEDLVGR